MRPPRFACHRCGAEFVGWETAQRHADAEHHTRVVVLLEALGRTDG